MNYDQVKELIFSNSNNKFESARGIFNVNMVEVYRGENIGYVTVSKSDGTKTLFVLVKTSRKYDSWGYLCPFDKQIESLAVDLPRYYFQIDNENKKARLKT